MKLLIDTDPGIDDAMAIIFAARHPGIELVGLTTVFGNVPVETATRNALALVEHCDLNVPVAQGAAQPLVLPPFDFPAHIHGAEGFGHLPPTAPTLQAVTESAAAFMTRLARENPGQITLCPIGPITNVAEAIRLDPDFARNIARIVVMGGALDTPGNITPYAEANTFHDPHALEIVLNSGAEILMIGLDVTMQVTLEAKDFRALAEAAPHDGGLLDGMAGLYLDFYRSVGKEGCALHDPMAVIACLHPEWFTVERTALACVTEGEQLGQTLRAAGDSRTEVALDCRDYTIRSLFLDVIRDAA
ncbi:nucleoside hydrolase [Paracoccus litorisediminis]|uniref:Nucleoside hydrolase n=1 Tax=Paracoccus litorisediminis TaxID=2006130 RepID=A0A844HQ55_9RHOB|nr:nucleoside hydrolase [Paracoccus litorisediminis]MTH60477.1 nucleoside hydrolase [Paracoccus litorisediminis]